MHVSVIIPTYNRVSKTLDAIHSVLNQSYKYFELIVVDDGSAENIKPIRKIAEANSVILIEQKHSGVSAARNVGIAAAQYEWVAFLDSDDTWLEKKLETQINFHKQNPSILLSQCNDVWYKNKRKLNKKIKHLMPKGDAFLQSLKLCCISPSSVMIKSEISKKYLFDETFTVCEDYELWLRLTLRYQIGLISDILVVKHGGHSDQLSKFLPAMDQFRIFALLKLLISESLTSDLFEQTVNELKHKLNIVVAGAQKRNSNLVDIFCPILDKVNSNGLSNTKIATNELKCFYNTLLEHIISTYPANSVRVS